jgi:hypothetical protein
MLGNTQAFPTLFALLRVKITAHLFAKPPAVECRYVAQRARSAPAQPAQIKSAEKHNLQAALFVPAACLALVQP